MTKRSFPLVLTALLGLAAPAACTSGQTTTGSSTGSSGMPPASVSVTVDPSPADRLTCSSTTFTAKVTGTDDMRVDWSVDPSPEGGSIDASGLYKAPIQVPAKGGATVTATSKKDPSARGTAQVTLATAHPKELGTVAASPVTDIGVWEHAVASRGQRAYAVWTSGAMDGSYFVYLARSDDGGKTWGAPVKINDNDGGYPLGCAAVAVDAADPDTVYVTYRFGVGGGVASVASLTKALGLTSGTTLAFAVSKNQGATFTNHVLLSGDNGYAICADIASPSAGAVVVSAPATTYSHEGMPRMIDLWVDAKGGDGFAAGGGDMSTYAADELLPTLHDVGEKGRGTFDFLGENGGSGGATEAPRLSTDGQGKLCISYLGTYSSAPATTRAYAQCSGDLGKTFTAPATLDPGDMEGAHTPHHPTGATGPGGEVAMVWSQETSADGGQSSVLFARSKDGASFDPPVAVSTYALPGGAPAYAKHASVRWEGSILWLAYAVGDGVGTRLVVDKSCDGGTTWSGAQIAAGMEGAMLPDLDFPGLFAAGDAGAMHLFAFGTGDGKSIDVSSLEP